MHLNRYDFDDDDNIQFCRHLAVGLCEYHHHGILGAKLVGKYAEAFDCPLICEEIDPALLHANPTETSGLGAEIVAKRLCEHLALPYDQKNGTGSQLREYCSRLTDHFDGILDDAHRSLDFKKKSLIGDTAPIQIPLIDGQVTESVSAHPRQ